ncbi:MAG: LysR family transcriptional regulator [Betaproteobacteria bacterium]
MDLNHLRSFVAVAKFAHLTRASESLHLSQPALSSHIKTLEEQFGVTLFERTPSGMELTPSGRRLLVEAEQILGAVRHLAHSAQDLRGQPTGNLKIGTVLDPAALRVGELTSRTLERYPQIELDLSQVMSSDALARMRNGAFDASFYFGAAPEGDLDSIPLRDIDYRVTVPTEWAARLVDAPWDVVAEQPWIVAPAPSSHHQLVMNLFGESEPRPERIIEADSEQVINNLVESAVGVSLIRDEIATQSVDAGRSVIWPGRHVTTKLWLVHSADRRDDPLIVALLDVLRDVWKFAPNATADKARVPSEALAGSPR